MLSTAVVVDVFISRWSGCAVIMGRRRPRASPTSDRRRFQTSGVNAGFRMSSGWIQNVVLQGGDTAGVFGAEVMAVLSPMPFGWGGADLASV